MGCMHALMNVFYGARLIFCEECEGIADFRKVEERARLG